MIGLDTNVIVRYIMQDDAKQAALATTLIESLTTDAPGFISIVTLVETVWVLKQSYGLSRPDLVEVIEGLLSSHQLVAEKRAEAYQALTDYKASKGDYSECLIERLGRSAGCTLTYTFDQSASRHAGMTLLMA
ncbi:PIN domain-containing protein [Asticcacaulis sp. AND118]|uniref:PIN domain-containing protein n=1 Tax=Asticcacaulis sp. AND118 TaxID=2840468 RepID=UPI001CFFA92C|nr:type II toxin-antitoxin system VapC family toxin [Asticcacaulis sp. AND118]UDF03522.1 type II toxin-antitoxin system VapC family toxin [Asticcacaulis sp. AND118]